jgi:hypothetical protein
VFPAFCSDQEGERLQIFSQQPSKWRIVSVGHFRVLYFKSDSRPRGVAPRSTNTIMVVSPKMDITVEGGSRGPVADREMAKWSVGKVEASIRNVVGRQIGLLHLNQ